MNILSLPSIYVLQCLLYIKSNFLNLNFNNQIHEHYTRNTDAIRNDFCKFSTTQKNIFYMAIKLFNALPQLIKTLELNQFKKLIKRNLLLHSIYTIDEYFTIVNNFK